MPDVTARRPRYEIPRAQDNGPTPERLAKGDYEGPRDRRRRASAVVALHAKGEIDGDAVHAAQRWYRDYAFGNLNHLEISKEDLPDEYMRGDVHTWAISRGKARARVSLVREVIGTCSHRYLEMVLVEGLSFSTIAGLVYPDMHRNSATTKVSQRIAAILTVLPTAYQSAVKRQKEDQERTKNASCTFAKDMAYQE